MPCWHAHSKIYEEFIRDFLARPSLNLGCGGFKIGDVNVDMDKGVRPDVLFNLEDLPFPFKKDVFGSVVLHHSLEHLEEPEKTLIECKSLMKRGGKIVVVVPTPTNKMYRMVGHKQFYTKKSIKSLLEKHFTNVKVFGYKGDTKEITPSICRIFGMVYPNQYVCIGECKKSE